MNQYPNFIHFVWRAGEAISGQIVSALTAQHRFSFKSILRRASKTHYTNVNVATCRRHKTLKHVHDEMV